MAFTGADFEFWFDRNQGFSQSIILADVLDHAQVIRGDGKGYPLLAVVKSGNFGIREFENGAEFQK